MTKRIEELPKICFSDWPGKPKERKSEVQFGHVNLVGLANPEVWKLGYFLTVAETQEYLRLRDENAALRGAIESLRDCASEFKKCSICDGIIYKAIGVKLEEKK